MLNMVQLLNFLPKMRSIVIVGAGWYGEKLARRLLRKNVKILYFFDNDKKLHTKSMFGIDIIAPIKISDSDVYYLVSTNTQSRQPLCRQLLSMGIDQKKILIIDLVSEDRFSYHAVLREDEYKGAISDLFYYEFGRELNWESPQTYNEKLNWEKLNARSPLKTRLADKYLVRDWIKEQIGEKYLTRLYGVWDNSDEINFDALPEQFVLKTNHASTFVIVVKEKKDFQRNEIVDQLDTWMKIDFSNLSLEMQYKNIPRKIICEEYLPDVADSVYEYQFYCFHGQPMYIWCVNGSHKLNCKASFYDKEWHMLPFSYGYPKDETPAPRPKNLEEMWALSQKLCYPFTHVRVDWYNLPDGRVVFGEMTFSTWGGLMHFQPEEYDEIWGSLI